MSNRAKQNSRSCVIADLGYIVPLDRAYQRKSTGRMKVNFKSGLKYFRGCIIWVAKCTSGLDNINSLVSTLCPACRRGRGTKGTPSQLAPTHPPPITHHHTNPTQPRLGPPCRKVLHWSIYIGPEKKSNIVSNVTRNRAFVPTHALNKLCPKLQYIFSLKFTLNMIKIRYRITNYWVLLKNKQQQNIITLLPPPLAPPPSPP